MNKSNIKPRVVKKIEEAFNNASDFSCKYLFGVYVIYLNGFIDQNLLDSSVIQKIVINRDIILNKNKLYNKDEIINMIELSDITINLVSEEDEIIDGVLNGKTLLVFNDNSVFSLNIKTEIKRDITEPTNENVIKGSKEGFIEGVDTNILLIRKKVKSSNLKFIDIDVGEISKTKIVVTYLDNVADSSIVDDILNRIKNIKTDNLNCLATFEENFVDNKYNIFPQLLYTERPEKTSASIMEGKVCILINGYPTVYILPVSFPMFMQSSEEYASNYLTATLIRILRYIAFLIALFLPAFYTAVVTFHHEMIPTKLASAIIRSKQDVPIPAFVEVIIMLIAFEMLLEAGARMPKNVGQTISIVGGLIIGEAAVNAKFVSPSVVVVIATVGIAGFLIPNQDLNNTVRITRILLVILATMAGLIGVLFGTIIVLYYMCGMKSFGKNYMAPFAGDYSNIFADSITRLPNDNDNKKARW